MSDGNRRIPQPSRRYREDRAEASIGLGPAGSPHEVWRELVGIDLARHQTPGGSFAYVAERLIEEGRLREAALRAMREVLARCREKDGELDYVAFPRAELDAEAFERAVRENAPGFTGRFMLATRAEIMLRNPWMSDVQYDRAFLRYSEVMTGADGTRPFPRVPLATLFGVPHLDAIREFEMPARGVLTGHLVHRERMGELAEFLAVAAGLCAVGHDLAERACAFVTWASKAPPLVVHNETGPHLVFICAD